MSRYNDCTSDVGEYAFRGKETLKYIVFPESVKTIGEHAFYGASNLKQVRASGVEKLDTYACEKEITRETVAVDATGHTPSTAVEENYIAPTCTENGSKDVVVYCSTCEKEISRKTVEIDATGHADNDGDGYCDADNELLDPTVECECNCHKDGIKGFFWNIKIFFSKLFRTNKMCECGVAHY